MSSRRRMRPELGALLALCAWLGGCAQLPFFTARESGNPEAFEAQGRMYVRYDQRAFSGSLRWQHGASADQVWLGAPLGQTVAHIERNASGAELTTTDREVYRATSIEALTQKGLGWSLPLADLSYYVVGKVPPEAAASAERDATGRIVRAAHNGWSVRWVNRGADERPGRIELAKDDVEIRLVVDRLEPGVAP